ncbi:MAG: cation transporter [Deltaproteobacteria bacterium]|nr:cation transporter [Deltaproteobacteria bacterium]
MDKNRQIDADSHILRRVTTIGLVINILLSALKFTAGIMGRSQALVADAIHSLSDTISDLAIIIGSYYWDRPADAEHPYGHRRIETLITMFVGVMLLLAGLVIIRQAIVSTQSGAAGRPEPVAAWMALVSVVVKELLYRWTQGVGHKINSPAMVANAWHHRSDAFSSVPVLLAILASMVLPGWAWLDRAGAVVVSLFILQAAYGILQPGFRELLDGSAAPEICAEISALAESFAGVLQVHRLRVRISGARLYVDLHLVVDGNISVRAGHDIAVAVKKKIMKAGLDAADVVIHVEPDEAIKKLV